MRASRPLIPLLAILCFSGCGGRYVVKGSQIEEPGARVVGEELVEPDLMEYATVKGDTLAKVAADHLGWDRLWLHLKEWNKLPQGAKDPLPEGTKIVIPLRFKPLAGARAAAAVAPALQPAKHRVAAAPPKPVVRPPSQVFRVGEKLTFDVKWYAITGGQATLTLAPMDVVNGEPCWHIIALAKSKIVFFFKVEDRIESFSTAAELLPVQFEKHLHEGRYRKDLVAIFDRDRGNAKWGSLLVPLNAGCRDLLSAFYWFRTMALPPPGQEVNVCVHTDKTNFPMGVKILRRETVKVPAGTFRTILIKPFLKFEGLWRQRGDILIWVTDDAAHIPVLVRSKVFLLGSVDIVLTKLERPQ